MKTSDVRIMIFSSRMGMAYAHGIAQGVGRFARQRPNWHVAPYVAIRTNVPQPDRLVWDGEGAIIHDMPRWMKFAKRTKVIQIGNNALIGRKADGVFRCDNFEIGQLAADHLLGLGFTRFVYFGQMAARRDGFASRIAEAGAPPPICVSSNEYSAFWNEWVEVNPALRDWIRDLPKPVGVFAQSDIQARRIAWAAREAGRSIPEDLALIGVDNDHMLCNLCSPPLSSVEQPTELLGYRAAELLDGLLRGEPAPESETILPPLGVVARESTGSHVGVSPIVREALTYLRTHFQQDVPVEEVAEAVGTSRRSLERAFRENLGRTVLAELTHLRIAQACESLRSTSWTLDKVAENSGFQSLRQFHDTFQKKIGSTPATYRRTFHMR